MKLSSSLGSWHSPKQNLSQARLYLGVTSLADLNKATHVCEALLAPSLTGLSASVSFGRARQLPVMPRTVTLTGANAVFEDVPMAYLLSGGRVRVDAQTTLGIHVEYDSSVLIESVSVRADWRFPYCSQSTMSVSCGSFSETVLRLSADVVYPKKFNVNQTSSDVLITLNVPTGELTLIDLLPVAPLQGLSPPKFGLLVDTYTGSVLYVEGLTLINSVPTGFELEVI